MKLFLKILTGTVVGISALGLVLYLIFNEPLPKGEPGEEAEELAHLMLDALNQDAFKAIETIKWTYPGGHIYAWNKSTDSVNVKWESNEVTFYTKTLQGRSAVEGVALSGSEHEALISEAWALFANDSFWLVAPYKITDPGTVRSLVVHEGRKCLLVTYTSGGVTPGDSYLWILDNQYRPVAWKFWTQKIPLGGLEFSWEDWVEHKGAWFAQTHKGPKVLKLEIGEVI